MKKLIILFTILFVGLAVNAKDNYLHTIILEGTDDGYNIVLKSDTVPVVTKKIKGHNNLMLSVKGIKTSKAVSAIYKSTNDVNSLIIENISDDEFRVYIQAKDISKSTIISLTKDNQSLILSERFPTEKVAWSITVLIILAMLIKSARAFVDYENSLVIKKDIKDREIELYRSFQRELANKPDINCKIKNIYASSVMPRSRRNYKELIRR